MRKADYAALAGIIRHRVEHHNAELQKSAACIDKKRGKTAYDSKSELDIVARAFASNASVKQDEFLQACGLKSN